MSDHRTKKLVMFLFVYQMVLQSRGHLLGRRRANSNCWGRLSRRFGGNRNRRALTTSERKDRKGLSSQKGRTSLTYVPSPIRLPLPPCPVFVFVFFSFLNNKFCYQVFGRILRVGKIFLLSDTEFLRFPFSVTKIYTSEIRKI